MKTRCGTQRVPLLSLQEGKLRQGDPFLEFTSESAVLEGGKQTSLYIRIVNRLVAY